MNNTGYRAEVWGKEPCQSQVRACKEDAIAECLEEAARRRVRGIKQIAVTRWEMGSDGLWRRIKTEGIERFTIADAKLLAKAALTK